uniref:Uncharacterized protein n=1 Tax=Oryza barthii TaxID=65489 RepID=A0A0D3H0B4_9ORYZ
MEFTGSSAAAARGWRRQVMSGKVAWARRALAAAGRALPAVTLGVGWVTAAAGVLPAIAGRWVGGEAGLAMERGGFAVLEAGQFAFALLVFPTVVPQLLAMAMERLRDAGPPTLMEDREMLVSTNAAMELPPEQHPECRVKWNQIIKEIEFPCKIGFVLLGFGMIGSLIIGFSPENEFSRQSIGWILADVGLFGWHALSVFFLLPKVIRARFSCG